MLCRCLFLSIRYKSADNHEQMDRIKQEWFYFALYETEKCLWEFLEPQFWQREELIW